MKWENMTAQEIENLRTQYPEEKALMFYQTLFSIYTGTIDRHVREMCTFNIRNRANDRGPDFRFHLQTAFNRGDRPYDENSPVRTFVKFAARTPIEAMPIEPFIEDPEKHIGLTHMKIGAQYKDCPYPLTVIFVDATQALMAGGFRPVEYHFEEEDHVLKGYFLNEEQNRSMYMEVNFQTLMNDFAIIQSNDEVLRVKATRLSNDLKLLGKRPKNLRSHYRVTPRSVDVDGDRFHEFHTYSPNGPQISDWKRDEDWVLPEGRAKPGQYIMMGDFLFRLDDVKGLMTFLSMTVDAGIDGAAFAGGILGQANLFNVLKGKFDIK